MPDVKVAESNNEFNEVVPEGEEDQEKQGGGSGQSLESGEIPAEGDYLKDQQDVEMDEENEASQSSISSVSQTSATPSQKSSGGESPQQENEESADLSNEEESGVEGKDKDHQDDLSVTSLQNLKERMRPSLPKMASLGQSQGVVEPSEAKLRYQRQAENHLIIRESK